MCTEVDYLPRMMILADSDRLLGNDFDRKNTWTPSATSPKTNSTSWLERKLFSNIKRFFRRNSQSSNSTSSVSSRRSSSLVVSASSTDESTPELEQLADPLTPPCSPVPEPEPLPSTTPTPIDVLYDYNHLLARCRERQERDRTEMIQRCQTPISIPHADLVVSRARSTLINWRAYVRLCRALNRSPQLFQNYVDQYFACQSTINPREQLTFDVRTNKTTFDNLLRTFLNDYVTCLTCQQAQTRLIKLVDSWRIECQLCGSQRTVKRLRRKRSN